MQAVPQFSEAACIRTHKSHCKFLRDKLDHVDQVILQLVKFVNLVTAFFFERSVQKLSVSYSW